MFWQASGDRRQTEDFVREELERIEDASWYRFLLVPKDTDTLIGTGLIFWNPECDSWDISYNLGRQFWGRGYMTEAMGAVMAWAKAALKIKTCVASHAVENPASGRVLEKLGLRYETEIPYVCGGGRIHTVGRQYRWQAEPDEANRCNRGSLYAAGYLSLQKENL